MKLLKLLSFPVKCVERIFSKFRNTIIRRNVTACTTTVFLKTAKIINFQSKDSIFIDENTVLGGELFTFAHKGNIVIGKWCYIGEGSKIWSSENIEIGNHVLISHNVNIHDTNSHPLCKKERHTHFLNIMTQGHPQDISTINAAPVCIKDDAWIGFNSIILKGVTIGEGAIVGAGSVVTKDVAPYTLVAGNPAKVIRTLEQD